MNCYILTGGRSKRMGRSKVDLPFAGATFLGHMVATAEKVFPRVVAVQRPDGEPLRGVETIFEQPHESEAPIFGVLRALQHARERCFVVAVDYPLLGADVLAFLCKRFEGSGAPMLVPEWSGARQVLCAGYSAALLPRIESGIAAGKLDLRGVATDAEVIPESELRSLFHGEPLMNVNTPEELEEARRLYERQGLLTSR